MKLLYNWLKEFVDVTDAPAGVRSRLSLSGLSVDSIEETAAGPLLDAEVTINRPDCMGHYGVARENRHRLPIATQKNRAKIKRSGGSRVKCGARDDRFSRIVRTLHSARDARHKSATFAGVAPRSFDGNGPDLY